MAKRTTMVDRKLSKVIERESEKDMLEDESRDEGKKNLLKRKSTLKFSKEDQMKAI